MSTITSEMVKQLREKTGAGMMDCKKALVETGGDFDKAIDYLRQKGLAQALKKSERKASQGLVTSYIHMDRIGVLVEINCETDFVARTDEFKDFCKDVAMQIAAQSPSYIKRDDIPPEVIEKEKEIYRASITENKPSHVIEKIIEGKLEKFYEEQCLLEQFFIKDTEQKKRVMDILNEKIARFGENIVIRRFARFQVGELEAKEECQI